MRLLATADLHYNHPKSRRLADDLIDQMCAAGGDVLLVIGDTAAADGDALEQCLSRFRFAGPKLAVAGNHELWTAGPDSHAIYAHDLPRRVASVGWHWLDTSPLVIGDIGFVGSVGWYDYSFAPPDLGIPRRFYEHKVAPGSAAGHDALSHLLDQTDDIAPDARDVYARWNDGRFVKLGRSDEAFLDERIAALTEQLRDITSAAGAPTGGSPRVAAASRRCSRGETPLPPTQIVAALHHLPFRDLLPPPRSPQWDFAKAFLGSDRLGRCLLDFPAVRTVLCGHSHFPAEAQVGPIRAINIGSGYRWKTFVTLDIE